MFKTCVKCWATWGLQGYVISPVIDAIIPENKGEFVQTIKEMNQIYGGINRVCFNAPIYAVKEGVNFIKEKTGKKAEG